MPRILCSLVPLPSRSYCWHDGFLETTCFYCNTLFNIHTDCFQEIPPFLSLVPFPTQPRSLPQLTQI